jgi:hypothetical protein
MLDGSEHAWLEDRGPRCHLLALIDDATSRVGGLFTTSDCTETNFQVLEGWLKRYGRPVALYTDKNSIYAVNLPPSVEEQLTDRKPETQFSRALGELDIRLILAHSPQAKGRIERLFGTLQNRLVKEMRLADIRAVEEANQFLWEIFLPQQWPKFTVEPARKDDAHRPLATEHRLEEIFCHRERRTVANDLTVAFQGQTYVLDRDDARPGLRGARVEVERRRDGKVWLRWRGEVLPLRACPKPLKALPNPKPEALPKPPAKPALDHPWRKPFHSSQPKEGGAPPLRGSAPDPGVL